MERDPGRSGGKVRLIFLAALLSNSAPATAGSVSEPVISEFQAAVGETFLDEDGDSSDWIEIHNPGDAAVSLDGWYLTDDPSELRKWRLPAVSLARLGFLVVFASGKDRSDPASELHASFKLASEGGYLALVRPDGTVSFAFAAAYPPQFRGDSYGLVQDVTEVPLLAPGAAAASLVPSNDSLGLAWTGVGFDDSGWIRGTTGAGFDAGADYPALIGTDLDADLRGIRSSAFVRIPFTAPDPLTLGLLTLRMKYDDGFVAYLNGHEVARRNAPDILSYASAARAEHGQPLSGSMSQDFDGGGTGYVLKSWGTVVPALVQGGGPDGKFLHLMEDYTGSLINTIGFDRTFGPSEVVTADFDFRMAADAGYTGGERADGFGFALLSTSVYGTTGPAPASSDVVWERPRFPGVFAVGFDIYDGSRTENTVSVDYNGTEVGAVKVAAFQLNSGVFNHAHIEVRKDAGSSLVSVTLTPDSLGTPGAPVTVFDRLRVPGLQPFDARVGFGGRTGGEFVSLDLDNIGVHFTPLSPTIQYEEIDISSGLDFLQAGQNILAVQGLNIAAGDKDFLVLPELHARGIATVPEVMQYFAEPTPGAPNGAGFAGVAEAPVFSRKGGTYFSFSSLSLSLTVRSTMAVIRYTLDRTIPDETSRAYTAPLSIVNPTVVMARAFEAGLAPGPLVTQCYLMLAADVQSFTSNLPIMVVHTFGQALSEGFIPAQAVVLDLASTRSSIRGAPDWSGLAGIKWRGSSSLGFPKKNFGFETRDEKGEDLDVSILGFPEQSDWILYGPYTDKTLMRDVLSYYWSNQIGRYAVRARFIELFLDTGNGKVANADYQGVYAFMEKIKRDPFRVDVHKLYRSETSEPEITGGYILKKDRMDPGDVGFSTQRGQVLAYVYPKEQDITPAERAWIKGYLGSFETALYGTSFRDPVNGYAKYIDADSFIDHHILVEMTKNIDGFRLSTFLFKDRGGKLNMGPIWDYNLTLGNADYLEGWIPEGWYWEQLSDWDYPWYRRLFQDPDFAQRYADRWAAFRKGPLQTAQLLAGLDGAAALLRESQARNFVKWPILGTYVWPNWFIGQTYQEEVDWMKGWLEARLVWYDSNYPVAPSFSQDGGKIDPGFSLSMTAPAGTIYYTIDGSDPRRAGGSISTKAKAYGAPIVLNENTRVTARARIAATSQWSPPAIATFAVATPRLAITEVMYHPPPPPQGSPYSAEDFEFVEIQNIGAAQAVLMGVRFTEGIIYDFSTGSVPRLEPGAYAVVVKNLAAFKSRYGSAGINIAGACDRNLANGGDVLRLEGPLGDTILEFGYQDGWFPQTDGAGRSLVIRDPWGPPDQWGKKDAWRSSSVDGGSPGRADPTGFQLPGDGNQDSRLDLSDALFLLAHLFGFSTTPLPCDGGSLSAGGNLVFFNLNGDSFVDISDVVFLLGYLFLDGAPPVPGTACVPITGCSERCTP